MGHLKISKKPTGNGTRNLPSCDAVRQPTEPLATPLKQTNTQSTRSCLLLMDTVFKIEAIKNHLAFGFRPWLRVPKITAE
jgi:hypothetical protein